MRNIKGILAGALLVPALALGGGLAYATSTGGHPAPARPAVTTVARHHPVTQASHGYCGWRYGDHRCGWRGHSYQRHPGYQHHGYRGYQGGYPYRHRGGYQGGWGYQRSGQYGGWGYGGGWRHGGGCGCGW